MERKRITEDEIEATVLALAMSDDATTRCFGRLSMSGISESIISFIRKEAEAQTPADQAASALTLMLANAIGVATIGGTIEQRTAVNNLAANLFIRLMRAQLQENKH